jgi:hypothetical protein
MVAQIGYLMVGRSGGQVTLGVIYTVHEETRSVGFLVEPQTKVDGLSVVWPQNHWDKFLQFSLKTVGDGFLQFDLKIGGDVFLWFGLKTGGSGCPILASKPCRLRFVGCAIKPTEGGWCGTRIEI